MSYALKYRPKTFSDVKGQDACINILSKAITEKKLAHAITLSGIRGIGKTTIARIIAQALNCPDNGCGACESCIAIQNGAHMDVLEIDAASYTGVDNIREIIESSQYKAIQGSCKVYIIDEAHMLSKSAFNALLKNLEEPKSHVYYILATTEVQKIPDTILSRCMLFALSSFSIATLKSALSAILESEGYTIEQAALDEITFAAQGSMRDAIMMLSQAVFLSQDKAITDIDVQRMLGLPDRKACFEILEYLLSGRVEEAITAMRSIESDPVFLYQIILDMVYWLCCLKHAPHLRAQTRFPEVDRVKGAELADAIDVATLFTVWSLLNKGYEELLQSAFQHQAVEMILLRLCFINTDKPASKKFEKFDHLLAFIKKSREPLLSVQLEKLAIAAYSSGSIRLHSAQGVNISEVKNKLDQLTQMNWTINMIVEGKQSSLVEEFKSQPHVQDILKTFPDAQVVLTQKGDK